MNYYGEAVPKIFMSCVLNKKIAAIVRVKISTQIEKEI